MKLGCLTCCDEHRVHVCGPGVARSTKRCGSPRWVCIPTRCCRRWPKIRRMTSPSSWKVAGPWWVLQWMGCSNNPYHIINCFVFCLDGKTGGHHHTQFRTTLKLLYFERSPPWRMTHHLEIHMPYILTFYLAFFLPYIVTFFPAFYLASVLAYFLAYILAFCLAFSPACVRSPGALHSILSWFTGWIFVFPLTKFNFQRVSFRFPPVTPFFPCVAPSGEMRAAAAKGRSGCAVHRAARCIRRQKECSGVLQSGAP